MPRPLIIKVNDHKPQSNNKATGSIDVQLLKTETFKISNETYSPETQYASNVIDQSNATDISQCGSSMVRSLINRYESSTAKSNLEKFKSKSLVDLPKPLVAPTTNNSQDDSLYNKNLYNSGDNRTFDFKRVFSKFEDPGHLNKRIVTSHQKNYSNENINFADLKHRARLLLDDQLYEHNHSLWRNQVVELLQQIGNFDAPLQVQTYSVSSLDKKAEYVPVLKKEEKLPLKIQDFDKDFNSDNVTKVKDIKNIFEDKSETKRSFSRTNSANYSTYFGVKGDEDQSNNEHRQYKSSISIQQLKYFNGDSFIDQNQDGEVVDKFTSENCYGVADEVDNAQDTNFIQSENSGKVDELKYFFESEPVLGKNPPYKYLRKEEENFYEHGTSTTEETVPTIDNRMLPPPRIYTVDGEPASEDVESSLARIKELTELLEHYEHKIDMLTDEDEEEANYINEYLIRILIKLDEVTTYKDKYVLAERKNAIKNVQNCIEKLKAKVSV